MLKCTKCCTKLTIHYFLLDCCVMYNAFLGRPTSLNFKLCRQVCKGAGCKCKEKIKFHLNRQTQSKYMWIEGKGKDRIEHAGTWQTRHKVTAVARKKKALTTKLLLTLCKTALKKQGVIAGLKTSTMAVVSWLRSSLNCRMHRCWNVYRRAVHVRQCQKTSPISLMHPFHLWRVLLGMETGGILNAPDFILKSTGKQNRKHNI